MKFGIGHFMFYFSGGVYLPPIYICIVLDLGMTLIWCTSMQGLYAWGGGVYLHPIYICIVLDIAIKLIWCSGMQGLYAQLMWGLSASNMSHSYIYIYIKCDGMQGICSQLTMEGIHLSSIYICIVLEIAILDHYMSVSNVKLPFLTTRCQ